MYFFFYRYRFLILYILFGFASLLIELVFVKFLQSILGNYIFSALGGFTVGLISAFILNIRFNFHIAQPKRKKALIYFAGISFVSFCIQLSIRRELIQYGISIELSRFIIAGCFFSFSYLLHRWITFKDYKKVGVAIYADGVDDVRKIYSSISDICDFIHVDIVDRTFKSDCPEVKAYKAEVVRAFWQKKPIEVHIMSKTPTIWLKELLPFVNTIYIHLNIEEDINHVLALIKNGGCAPGIVLGVGENYQQLLPYLPFINHVLLLSIPNPGYSGQSFDMEVLTHIDELNKNRNRNNFNVCVDGGVNNKTIGFLNVDSVVSGSFVLNADNPIKNIMYLQTSGEYERY